MNDTLKVLVLNTNNAELVLKGNLDPGGFTAEAVEIIHNGNPLVSCKVIGVVIPDWCIDGIEHLYEVSRTKVQNHLRVLTGIALKRAKGELLDALRRLESQRADWGASDEQKFFGASVKGAGEVKIFLSAWLVGMDEPDPNSRLAEFSLRVTGDVKDAGDGIRATSAITVTIHANGNPFLRVGLDDFNFSFPEIDFPKLDLTQTFSSNLPDGQGGAALLAKLSGFPISGNDVTIICTDLEADKPPRLELKAEGDHLNWAIVKHSYGDPEWNNATDLELQLATFKVTLERNGNTGTISGIQVAGVAGSLIAKGALAADVLLLSDASRSGSLGPITYHFHELSVTLKAAPASSERAITARVKFNRLLVTLVDDPQTFIALEGEVDLTPSGARVVELKLVEPYLIQLVQQQAHTVLERGVRAVATFVGELPTVEVTPLQDLLDILGKFAVAVARQDYVVGSAIAGAAEEAASVLASVLDSLTEGIAELLSRASDLAKNYEALSFQVTLGLDPIEVLQILVMCKAPFTPLATTKAAGFEITVYEGWRLGLLIDLAAQRGAYLVALPETENLQKFLTLGTDLWLESDENVSQMPDADSDTGDRPKSRLIQITSEYKDLNQKPLVVLAGLRGNRGVFFKEFKALNVSVASQLAFASPDCQLLPINGQLDLKVEFKPERLLPLLGMGETGETDSGGDNGFLEKLKAGLGQVVWVKEFKPKLPPQEDRKLEGILNLGIKAAGVETEVGLGISLDLDTLRVKFEHDKSFGLASTRIEEEALGLTWVIEQADPEKRKANIKVEMFTLDFSKGESAFALNTKEARMELRFGGLSSDGEGVVFKVEKFRVGRNGVDISAKVDDRAVRLNGLDVPFRFQSGSFEMRAGRLLEASISGRGSLPPDLVGEADCTLALAFTQTDAGIELQSGKVEIDKKGEPIICHSTRFTLTVTDLDVGIQKDGGYHFYFLVTGSLRFTPKPGEFESGLLGLLKDIEINLERTPLTGDARVLAKHISFQKALSPKKTFNLFNVFSFELRAFGFHPSCPRFDGSPAINLSGQIKFAEIGDVMQPKIDFHGLWIAPPKKGEALPRISAEGLGIDLQLAGAVKIRGSVLAVDPGTKTVEGREFAPPGYDTYGFLGEGEVEIPGWGAMPAALGFMELEKKGTSDRKKAFFVYLQRDKLAIKIPTGFWTFYMREVGFGLGYRYTLAAIRDADAAPSLPKRIQVLDDASKRQGDLARFAAWSPDPEGDKFTLALRGALQAYPAKDVYVQKEEEAAENPFFFDLVVALRSDLTLLASLRGYLGVNYADFRANTDNLRERPGLRGYLYISPARSELLARMIGDSKGHIGERLPSLKKGQILRKALESVDWSSTLYIRPGLFQHELGWPNQLAVRLLDEPNMKVWLRGGMIFRAAEDGLLWGYNIEADAWFKFGGSAGGDIGIAIEATLQARLLARLIAYLSWRFQGSMMYGLISLDATITFNVRAWMRVNLRFTSFTIRIGFSYSLHFSAAIEMVVGTEGVGARVQARVAISAFGCTLGVYVGFSFNDGALENARSRVQRFMAMSLTSEQPSEPPKLATENADQRVDQSAQRVDIAKPDSNTQQYKQPTLPANDGYPILDLTHAGREIKAANFWMVLHDDPRNEGHAYALLVPREANDLNESGFYCSPMKFYALIPNLVAHTLHFNPDDSEGNTLSDADLNEVKLIRLTERTEETTFNVEGSNSRAMNWVSQVPTESGSAPVTLASLFDQCFITSYKHIANTEIPAPYFWKEPLEYRVTLNNRAQVNSGSEQERAIKRDQMQKDQQAHASRMPADERAYQGRSTVLAMFLDQFVTLASKGKDSIPNEAHVVDTGLVLHGPVKALENLAKHLIVEKADSTKPAAVNVKVLNPSDGWFTKQDPIFRAARSQMTETGPRFTWDLDVPFNGPAVDPEHYLQHYEILRTLEGKEFTPHTVRVKPAATYGGPKNLPIDGKVEIELLRPHWQFSDDLADLAPDWRRALLPPRNETETLEAARAWAELVSSNEDVTLTYSITPVDIAGTKGQPQSFAITIDRPQPAIRPAEAELRIFQDIGDLEKYKKSEGISPKSLEIYLALRDPAWKEDTTIEAGIERRVFKVKRQYRLYVEQEVVLPAGSFGSDGLTDRVRGLSGTAAIAAAIDRIVREDDKAKEKDKSAIPRTFLVDWEGMPIFNTNGEPTDQFTNHIKSKVEEDQETRKRLNRWALLAGAEMGGSIPKPETAKLVERLWSMDMDSNARAACRFWLRTEIEIAPEEPNFGEMPVRLTSIPTSVNVSLMLRKTEKKNDFELTRVVTALQPQAFEWPVHLDFPPLCHGQVRVETGFLHLLAPTPNATLKQWTESEIKPLRVLRDPERRTLAKLEFDAVPDWADSDIAPIHRSCIAGYDVHELDLDELAPSEAGNSRLVWKHSRRIAQVKLVPEDAAMLTPATNSDWLGWQAHYPSETWRTQRTETDLAAKSAIPVRKGWYSPAESMPAFAERFPRMRLLPHAVDSTVDELLAKGRPKCILAKLQCEAGSQAAEYFKATLDTRHVYAHPLSHYVQENESNKIWGTEGKFKPLTGNEFLSAELRYLLLCLCWPILEENELKDWREKPSILDGLQLVLQACQEACQDVNGDKVIATSIVRLDFRSPLHPVLEETIAELAWANSSSSSNSLYRKYAVAVQAPPTVDAGEFSKFLAATPPTVDPYGWGVLQSLGLAATLRLFDLELAEFVKPTELARRVNAVFSKVVERWTNQINQPKGTTPVLGQPFAEVLLRPGRDQLVRPFDGLPPKLDEVVALNWSDESLAMIQLSLRPAPKQEWKYLVVTLPDIDEEKVRAKPSSQLKSIHLEISTGNEKVPQPIEFFVVAVLDNGDHETLESVSSLAQLNSEASLCNIPVTRQRSKKHLRLLVRTNQAVTNFSFLKFCYVYTIEIVNPSSRNLSSVDSERVLFNIDTHAWSRIQDPATDLDNDDYDQLLVPFGRFPEIPADEWAAIGKDEPSDRVHFTVIQSLKFVAPELKEGEPKQFMPQYIEWAKRFLDHGLGPQALEDGQIALALAAPVRLSPFEHAVDSQGVLTLPIPSSDRLAHARAYAVKPVSRYAHVVASALEKGAQLQLETLVGENCKDEIGYAVAVHPRTERIEPPVILGNAVKDGAWELVLGRHGEESLAHSNRPLFARLGKPALLITQVRSYRTPFWPIRLKDAYTNLPEAVLYPEHESKSTKRPEWKNCPALTGGRIDELSQQYPSLWKGAEFMSFPGLPPHYQGAVLAVARAGIVVSNISTVVQDDFAREPVASKWTDALINPQLTIEREDSNSAHFLLKHRLLSHWDLTPEAAQTFNPTNEIDVAWWPDPDVIYNVIHEAEAAGKKIREELLEVRLGAHDVAKEPYPVVVRARGGRWISDPVSDAHQITHVSDDNKTTFSIEVHAKPKDSAPISLRLEDADIKDDNFQTFAKNLTPFATTLVWRSRTYELVIRNDELPADYAARLKDALKSTSNQKEVVKNMPKGVTNKPLVIEIEDLVNTLKNWFELNNNKSDEEKGRLLDNEVHNGDLMRFMKAAKVLWPAVNHDVEQGLLALADEGNGGQILIWDIPSGAEADALLKIQHRLAHKDSAFWQIVVQRITGGAEKLILRCVDARGPATGKGDVSVGEIEILWPDFVNNVVTPRRQA